MKKIWLCFDVGGTKIKAGILDENGYLVGKSEDGFEAVKSYNSFSKAQSDIFFEHLIDILEELVGEAADILREEIQVMGIGFAFPGPFDYKNGISLMKGLDKYDNLYGISIKDEVCKRISDNKKLLVLQNVKMHFVNDVEAFAVGASQNNRTLPREMCICIGTGCGSAFLVNGHVAPPETRGVPKNGYIYPIKFLSGTIDDYISRRGLCNITKSEYHREIEGYELSMLAQAGDDKAYHCFNVFGNNIVKALLPIINEFKPNVLIIGGQIVKSEELFSKEIKELCKEKDIILQFEKSSSQTAFKGLISQMK